MHRLFLSKTHKKQKQNCYSFKNALGKITQIVCEKCVKCEKKPKKIQVKYCVRVDKKVTICYNMQTQVKKDANFLSLAKYKSVKKSV